MDILNFLHNFKIELSLDNILIFLIIIVILIALVIFIKKIFHKKRRIKIANLNIKIANIGNVSIELDKQVSDIAHKTWIEIMTRKVGIPFDEENDVIVEVYDSWYQLFSIIRELLREIDMSSKYKNITELENILIKVLNDGLRPHLTKYQAKYRKWYNAEIQKEKNPKITPQELQKRYEFYDELVKDLKNTNAQMIQFAEELEKLI